MTVTLNAKPLMPRLHVWGHGHSWIVYTVGVRYQWVSMSCWYASKARALRAARELKRGGCGL